MSGRLQPTKVGSGERDRVPRHHSTREHGDKHLCKSLQVGMMRKLHKSSLLIFDHTLHA